MNTLSKVCLLCSKKLVGRSDKKFCNDACRNEFNNRLNSDENNLMRRINYALRKNRRILLDLHERNKTKVSQMELIASGFDFQHCTSIQTASNGQTIFRIYEMGYALKEKSGIEIFMETMHNSAEDIYERHVFPFPQAFA